MFQGELVAIFSVETRGQPLHELAMAELAPGEGLVGDRFSKGVRGRSPKPHQEVTLIEIEALEAAALDYQIEITPIETRRNLLTRGVPLNHLVGREFTVGQSVVLRGVELCEPCGHLEKLTRIGVEKALKHRGGLRAQIVRGGVIQGGDTVRPVV